MQMKDLITRVRAYTRDTTGTLFALSDVKDFVNEAIDRLKQIPELDKMVYLSSDSDEPILLPSYYHYMLALYGASRCFSQDEQHFPAQSHMEEFLNLLTMLELGIKEGSIVITDSEGKPVTNVIELDGIKNVYFNEPKGGVE